MAPWKGPRHSSWASNLNLSIVASALVIAAHITWSVYGVPPQALTTLLGVAGATLFGTITEETARRRKERDKTVVRQKRRLAVAESRAEKAEAKVAELEADHDG